MTMFVALNQAGKLTAIENAERGLACDCTCIGCGETVVARKGSIRGHHFAHRSNKESCIIQPETLLHLYAKEVICEAQGLQLPPLPGVHPSTDDKSSWWDFESVIPEVPQAGFQPDLVAALKDGTQLFIEIAVTSFIDDHKRDRIQAAGIRTIELDLSKLLTNQRPVPSEEVKRYILDEAHHKTWTYPASQDVLQPLEITTPPYPIEHQQPRVPTEHRFTIMQMWVSARALPSGAIAVRSWSYNPQITELLKSWRNELGGDYNPRYRNWIFGSGCHEKVLERLRSLSER